MKIIIEGVDGAGKTTLANILAHKYGLTVCHCTQNDPKDYNFYRYSAQKNDVVWDRHTLGELIYPYVFQRDPKLGPEDARLVTSYARKDGAKIFVLTADMDVLIDRLNRREMPEHPMIMRNLEMIDNQFKFYAKEFRIPIIDTSKMTLDEIFKLVEEKEII